MLLHIKDYETLAAGNTGRLIPVTGTPFAAACLVPVQAGGFSP